jgi:hypothetical protein
VDLSSARAARPAHAPSGTAVAPERPPDHPRPDDVPELLATGSTSRTASEVWALRGLVVITILGAALRLWVAWRANQRLPDDLSRLTGDEPGYDYVGWTIAQGHRLIWPGRAPGYPLLLAIVYLFFGHTYEPVLYVHALVGAAAIPLGFLVARRVLGAWSALAASALIAFHPTLVWQVERLMSEVLFTPLVLAAVLTLDRAIERPTRARLVLAGLAAGAMTLCRPATLLLFVIVPFLIRRPWRERLRAGAVYGAALGALVAPMTVYNAATYHTFVPVASSTGVVWQGSPDYWDLVQQGRPYISIWEQELNAKVNGGHDVSTIAGDRWFTRRGVRSIVDRPFVYGWYSAHKVAYLWLGSPAADWGGKPFDYGYVRTWFDTTRTVGIFYSRLLPVAAAAALVLLRRQLRRFATLVAVCAYFTVFHALTYAEVRHSEPLGPLVDILVVAGVVHLFTTARGRLRGAKAYEGDVPAATGGPTPHRPSKGAA